MTALRALILTDRVSADRSLLILSKPSLEPTSPTPHSETLASLKKMGVSLVVGNDGSLEHFDIILDGISGTGLRGEIRGQAAELTRRINAFRADSDAIVISIDVPSGASDLWDERMPLVKADVTLAIEPVKHCLYKPALRPSAGVIIPVKGIFPVPLMSAFSDAELLNWETERRKIPPMPPDAYKYTRGVVAIHAGQRGSAGAARIAARGAAGAGAGLVRLFADAETYPVLAASEGGVMVVPMEDALTDSRFPPDALLLGPGWGRGADKARILEQALSGGIPLILDADAIHLAKDMPRFNGKTILTPHIGELSAFLGTETHIICSNPFNLIRETARERNMVILFKSCVMIIAAPDGRLAVIDGMNPALGTGGTGDLLAGICVAIAARTYRAGCFDAYTCACAAASLLIEAGNTVVGQDCAFIDPLDLVAAVSHTAASAWLPAALPFREFFG